MVYVKNGVKGRNKKCPKCGSSVTIYLSTKRCIYCKDCKHTFKNIRAVV